MIDSRKDKPRHLGRGLESLLGPIIPTANDNKDLLSVNQINPNFQPDKELGTSFKEIDIGKVSVNPYQARTVFEEQ